MIPQEKFLAIIKFKPPTFVLPHSKDVVPSKNNHPTSSPSNLGTSSFLPKNNIFSLSKTAPSYLEKGNSFTLPFSSLYSSISTIAVTPTRVTAVAAISVGNAPAVATTIGDVGIFLDDIYVVDGAYPPLVFSIQVVKKSLEISLKQLSEMLMQPINYRSKLTLFRRLNL